LRDESIIDVFSNTFYQIKTYNYGEEIQRGRTTFYEQEREEANQGMNGIEKIILVGISRGNT